MDNLHPSGTMNHNGGTESSNTTESVVSLSELFYRILDKAVYIIIATIIGALLMGIVSGASSDTVYSSSSKLYLINTSDVTLTTSDLQVAGSLVNDYLAVFTTNELHQMVSQELDYKYSAGELSQMIFVSDMMDTHIINITITAANPDDVQLIANTYAYISSIVIEEKLNVPQPVLFESASVPVAIPTTNISRNIVIGAMAGFCIAFVVAAVFAIFDDRIRTPLDMERHFNIPTLGIMVDDRKDAHRLFGRGRH